jgi:hypothetical protein
MPRATYRYEDNSKSYTLTDDDVLWLAKSLAGEGGYGDSLSRDEASALAWTMFLRFFRWGNKWKSFKSLIRAFSQPTNPAWVDPNGPKCLKHPDHCTPARIARRQQIQGWSWDEIPYSARQYAQAFAEGTLRPVLGQKYVNFAVTKYAKRVGYYYKTHYFLTDQQDSGINWTGKTVVWDIDPSAVDVDPSSGGAIIPIGTAVLIAAVAGAIFYALINRGTI